ncbi:MAG: hypothetical protein OXU20_24740 [Myxococcales bacterium]|nr:hypothetical protein [Myxococcales bacterium]
MVPRRPPEKFSAAGWLAIIAVHLIVPLILVLEGRDPGWWHAWAFSLVVVVAGVGGRAWAERRHPGLQADRVRFGRGQQVKPWDRVLGPLMGFSVLYPLVIVGGLDHRYGWTTPFPTWASQTVKRPCSEVRCLKHLSRTELQNAEPLLAKMPRPMQTSQGTGSSLFVTALASLLSSSISSSGTA